MTAETPPAHLGFPTLFGPEKCIELAQLLDRMFAKKSTQWFGLWDAKTEFALFGLARDGEPYFWKICGPLNREQAKLFYEAEAVALAMPVDGDTSH
jgi:hypothetical protein